MSTITHRGPATPEQLSLYVDATGWSATATATVRYKASSSGTWLTGHPLYRIKPSLSDTPAVGTIPDAFAWPIIGLSPGTAYDTEVTLTDGGAPTVITASFTTRALPAAAGTPNKTIAAGSSSATIQTALNGLVAGDVIQFANGTYYVSGLQLNVSGSSGSPIYIRGASRHGVLLIANTRILQILTANHIIIENMLVQCCGINSGTATASSAFDFWSGATGQTRLTFRNITALGIDRFVSTTADLHETLVYENTAYGNNKWEQSQINNSSSWNDDGINIAGTGNCAWSNTLRGFGDSIAFAAHSAGDTLAENYGVHVYRNDIHEGCDDGTEADHCFQNCSFYDNRLHNVMTALSLDPCYAGPFLYARNITINVGRQPTKFNSTNSGYFLYNNTVVHTLTKYTYDGGSSAEAILYNANNGAQKSYSSRNNIFIHLGSGVTQAVRFDNTGQDILDWDHNAYYPNGSFQWHDGTYSNLAAAYAGLPAVTPVFSGYTKRHEGDVITTSNPFTVAVVLGSDYRTKITEVYTPTLAGGSAPKNAGIAIPGITDGYSGAAPDMGAVISGRAAVTYGDTSFPGFPIPTYIDDLADYEALALTGTVTPANGDETIFDATPTEWQTSDPGNGNLNIVAPWSGGFKGYSRYLCVHGGGHADSANNGIYLFDFAGITKPVGWTLPLISAVADVIQAVVVYADGLPTSAHTYDGCVFASHNGVFYRFGGARYDLSLGGSMRSTWKYDPFANAWTQLTDHPNPSATQPCLIYSEEYGKVLVGFQGVFECAFFRCADDTWSARKTGLADFWPLDACGAWDPTRGRGILAGGDDSTPARLITIDWDAETVTTANLVPTGSSNCTTVFDRKGVSCFYDALLDVYWVFGGKVNDITDTLGYDNFYSVDAGTFAITEHALSGNAITATAFGAGSYGRFNFIAEWRAVGFVTEVDEPAYVIKLPGSVSTPPASTVRGHRLRFRETP